LTVDGIAGDYADLSGAKAAQLDCPADFTEPAGNLFLERAGRHDHAENYRMEAATLQSILSVMSPQEGRAA